jgi:mRNA-degrading endonuclease RelE of RelBE toxin-antitoxin system
MYTIELKSQPEKFIRDLPKDLQRQVLNKIETLRNDAVPANSEQLKDNPELRRIHSGRYRIIYHIQHTLKHVIITKIGDRKDVYRQL